jgi:hypothetical protein
MKDIIKKIIKRGIYVFRDTLEGDVISTQLELYPLHLSRSYVYEVLKALEREGEKLTDIPAARLEIEGVIKEMLNGN